MIGKKPALEDMSEDRGQTPDYKALYEQMCRLYMIEVQNGRDKQEKLSDLEKKAQLREGEFAELEIKLRESENAALTDHLTGLWNVRAYNNMMEKYDRLAKSEGSNRRKDKRSTSLNLAIFDLDHFKNVNDTYGHEAGDVVLKGIADYIRKSIRADSEGCRVGGEEFVILAPGSALDGAQLLNRLNKGLPGFMEGYISENQCNEGAKRMYGDIKAGKLSITMSAGVANYRESGCAILELKDVADKALYEAKGNGRNQVVMNLRYKGLIKASSLIGA